MNVPFKPANSSVTPTMLALLPVPHLLASANIIEIFERCGLVDKIIVIGLGRFGSALSRTLIEMGHEVLGLDLRQLLSRPLSQSSAANR